MGNNNNIFKFILDYFNEIDQRSQRSKKSEQKAVLKKYNNFFK